MTDLDKARQIINEVDKELTKLFEKRMDAVKLVAKYKKERGLPVENLQREQEVINRNVSCIMNEEYKPYFTNFLNYNMELSKNYQHRLLDGMKVAFSGTKGAFAEIAAKKIFPGANHIAYPDFKSAYNSVESGECDCVLLPLENSFNGDVGQVMDLAFFGKLYINGIYEAEIVQNLLGVKGAQLSDIKKVISHPQALGQCADFIEKHSLQKIECENTAIAAKEVSAGGDKTVAAIASEEAAKRYNLSVLQSHINQSGSNTTRFAVFSLSQKKPEKTDGHFILLFTVKNVAGSLGKAISVIGDYGFNLLSLKSRPTKELIWNYYFYAEGEGDISGEKGTQMLKKLSECCSDVKLVGSFEKEQKI
ncbi:MAG: chorismate mutase [Clostridia bacterium]|nr:chorismate mutase [Clostridia bacterium]